MKMGRHHLIASLLLLGASIVWNIWAYSKPRNRAVVAGDMNQAAAQRGAPAATVAVDPAAIPTPPAVNLAEAPRWTRSPFTAIEARPAVSPQTEPPSVDPIVGSILIAPDRRGAIVNGRVVRIGDQVGTAVIVEIHRDAVVFRLPTGELRRVRLQAPRPPREESR